MRYSRALFEGVKALKKFPLTTRTAEQICTRIKGVEETALWTTAKIAAIRALSEHTAEYVRAKLPKIYSHELVNLIFELPYCRIASLVEANIAKRQTASLYLQQLVEIGVLEEVPVTKEKLFIHPKLMQLLTMDNNKFTPYEKIAK